MNKSRSLNGSDPAGRNATFHDENRVELNERPGMPGAYLSRGSLTGSYRPLGKLFAPVKSQRYRLRARLKRCARALFPVTLSRWNAADRTTVISPMPNGAAWSRLFPPPNTAGVPPNTLGVRS